MFEPNLKLNPQLDGNLSQIEIEQSPTRNGFGEALLHLGETDPNVVALTGDLAESTRVLDFAKKYPERFIECGVAEQNMMGVAAGLALAGKTPFVSSYATFSPGRNWDQLRVSVVYSQANVKVVGAHSGISVGPDGATHQALEDIAITRVLPGLVVLVPCDVHETRRAVMAMAAYKGPVYIRFAREKTPIMTSLETPFEIGKAQVYKTGTDVSIIASGPLLYNAILAAAELEKEGVSVEIINNHTVKPLDAETILASVKKTGAVVTVEEHQIAGGCGSAVVELLAQNYPVPVEMIGMHDSFGESGKPDELINKYKMDSSSIVAAVKKVISRKN
jgi:transketolase